MSEMLVLGVIAGAAWLASRNKTGDARGVPPPSAGGDWSSLPSVPPVGGGWSIGPAPVVSGDGLRPPAPRPIVIDPPHLDPDPRPGPTLIGPPTPLQLPPVQPPPAPPVSGMPVWRRPDPPAPTVTPTSSPVIAAPPASTSTAWGHDSSGRLVPVPVTAGTSQSLAPLQPPTAAPAAGTAWGHDASGRLVPVPITAGQGAGPAAPPAVDAWLRVGGRPLPARVPDSGVGAPDVGGWSPGNRVSAPLMPWDLTAPRPVHAAAPAAPFHRPVPLSANRTPGGHIPPPAPPGPVLAVPVKTLPWEGNIGGPVYPASPLVYPITYTPGPTVAPRPAPPPVHPYVQIAANWLRRR